MNTVTILLIEHDDDIRDVIKDYLLQGGFGVLEASNPEDIEAVIAGKYLDLVLTDVFWPDAKTGEEEWPRLGEVIENIRKHDLVVPIVVLTHMPESCEQAEKHEDEILDAWSKTTVGKDFFSYGVKSVLKRRQNKFSEDVLLNAVLSVCDEDSSAWNAEKIVKFVRIYQRLPGLGDMLSSIADLFSSIGYAANLRSAYVSETFSSFEKMEPMDLARKENSWGHLRHTLSVFLGGYVVLNSRNSTLRKKRTADALKLSDWEAVNKAWVFASAFHDTRVAVEHIPDVLKKLEDIPGAVDKKRFDIDMVCGCKVKYLATLIILLLNIF